MGVAGWTLLVYAGVVLVLVAVGTVRDRRRTPEGGEGPHIDAKAWSDMLMVEGRGGNPPTGGAILPDTRPAPLARGRTRR